MSCRLDTNECAVDSTLCGSDGTCMNIDNGNFYSCDCNDGFEGNGASASDGSLTCVGRFLLSCLYYQTAYMCACVRVCMCSHKQFSIQIC